MGYSEAKETLSRLCRNNGWSYGVFWRFDPRNSMLLTMEDAYFEEQMRHVLDNMLLQVHLLGEGIIGEAAFTGKHQWIHADTEESCSNQFYSGVQTVAVIPIENRGVLQFGSVKKVMERAEFLKAAKKSFQDKHYSNQIHSTPNAPSSSSRETYDVNGLFASLLSQGNSNHSKLIQNSNFSCNDLLRNTIDPSPCVSEVYHAREASAYEDVSQIFTNPSMEGPCISSWSAEGSVLTSFEPSNVFDKKRSFEDLINSTDPVADISDSCLIDDLPPWFNLDLVNSECIADDYVANLLAKQASDNLPAPVAQSSERDPFDFTDNVYSGNEAIPCKLPRFSDLGLEELLGGAVSCATSNLVPKELPPKSQVGLWIDDIYSINTRGSSSGSQKRSDEPSKPTKKRARPGESTRPRPKDRQLIQDRLKELRGIIPNGSKCSIDALLDKTIKHMVFLQNVTKHSDKLKKAGESKRTILKDNTGGTTWAFEVGNQSMVCPIIVEDLASPGQMLIEMLCEEKGLFLEIADIVRGFGLNILKGTMEVREGKLWSHFIVEATRHVTRMDVFWSLVQILHQTGVSGVDSVDSDINNNNVLIDGGILPFSSSYKQSVLPLPIS